VSRAHCLDCGDHVVIDPAGRCPEGHDVGTAGARIEGAMGSHTPHPDEPEPWVARVDLGEDAPSEAPEAIPVREIRPPSVPVIDAAPGEVAATVRPDDLLRELHSLGDLDGPSSPRATPAVAVTPPVVPPTPVRPAAATPPVSAPVPAPTPAAAARPAFDELTALEAAVQALTSSNGSSSGADLDAAGGPVDDLAATNGHGDVNGHHRENGPEVLGDLDTIDDLGDLDGLVGGDGHRTGDGMAHTAVTPPTSAVAQPHAPAPDPGGRSVTDQYEDLFSAAASTPAAATPPPPEPRAPAPRLEVPSAPPDADGGAGDERWAVLADVAELAQDREAAPSAPPNPPPAVPSADGSLDLGNFTARGRRVGASKGKRRLFGR
jgi:hypothetical protein